VGNPKFPRKKYNTPLHPWKEERIKSEREIIKKYGLKSHREVWKAKTYLGRHRHQARELLAKIGTNDPQIKKESDQLLMHLTRIGILPQASTLDDVLALEIESVLSRRLQTLVYLKGLSTTPDHSRQLINHGHIAIDKKKVTIPSYMVTKEEESDIGYTNRSPLNEISHPARPKTEGYKSVISPVEDKKPDAKKEPGKPTEKPEIKKENTEAKQETKKPVEKPKEETEKKDGGEETKQEKTETKQEASPSEQKPTDDKKSTKPEDKSDEKKTESGEPSSSEDKKTTKEKGGN